MKLTIFTPAYNRAQLVYRLYESLERQTVKDFEWIIVDDASPDNTQEVVENFMKDHEGYDIIYYRQEHGGKHRAINYAVSIARGSFFFIVDSDDYLVDTAVEQILSWIEGAENEPKLAGVSGLRVSENGTVWGVSDNSEIASKMGTYVDATNFERAKYKLTGDKAEVYKTEILKQFPFPEFENEYFVTEAVVWDAIAHAGYKLRWYYEPIYICDYLEDGLTKNGANEMKGRINNYRGYCHFIEQSLRIVPMKERMVRFRAFDKTRKAMNKSMGEAAKDLGLSLGKYMYLLFVQLPAVYAVRMVDKVFK
jgi:glycosyltransferase involved in cell wall biosynthesis